MTTCEHQWQKIYEEALIGGAYPIGWQCKRCNKMVNTSDVPVTGLPGTDTGEKVLYGPHGGRGQRSDGTKYSKQIAYPDGRLEVLP